MPVWFNDPRDMAPPHGYPRGQLDRALIDWAWHQHTPAVVEPPSNVVELRPRVPFFNWRTDAPEVC